MLIENAKLESFTLDVIDRLKKGQQIEDSQVELKSNLIEPYKATRRIAGHANASLGQDIVWIFGISEKGEIIGIETSDIHDWFAKVKSYFDDVYPEFLELIISVEGKSVLAIKFKTSRVPYVIKNPDYGKSGSIENEVPIREGTSIRSARRADLIKILSTESRSIELELLNSYFYLTEHRDGGYQCNIHIDIYAFLRYNSQVPLTIPFHKMNFKISNRSEILIDSNGWNVFGEIEKDSNISGGKTEFLLFGASRIKINASLAIDTSSINYLTQDDVYVKFEPYIYELNRTISIQYLLVKDPDINKVRSSGIIFRWSMKNNKNK